MSLGKGLLRVAVRGDVITRGPFSELSQVVVCENQGVEGLNKITNRQNF